MSITLHRDVSGAAGAFGITLTAATDKNGKTWLDRINPMDYIEIRAANLGATAASLNPNGPFLGGSPGVMPMRFRGFVDSVAYTITIGPSGGPERAVLVQGRDYTKLFMVSNIQYLWTSSAIAAGMAAAQYGLTFNYNLPWQINTVKDFVHGVIDTVFNGAGSAIPQWSAQQITSSAQAASGETGIQGPAGYGGGGGQAFLPAFREGGVHVPNIQISCSVPDKYSIVSLAVQPYTGPFWNLLTYFQSPPLGECFVYDNEDGPVLVYRVTPLKDIDGYFIPPAQDPGATRLQLGHIFSNTDFNSGRMVAKSDNEVVNYVFVFSDVGATDGGSSAAYVSSSLMAQNFSVYATQSSQSLSTRTNPYWNADSTRKFGLRPLNIVSPWVPFLSPSGDYQELATELAYFAGKAYDHNEKLYSGTITCHGDSLFIPGRYIGFTDNATGDKWSFYLESVTDTFNFKPMPEPSWNCELGLTRGYITSSYAPAQ